MKITSLLLQAADIETTATVLERWQSQSAAAVIDEYLKEKEAMIAIPAPPPMNCSVPQAFSLADEPDFEVRPKRKPGFQPWG